MKKSLLRDAIVAQLRTELARQTAAANLARDEAISEESQPENKYDTHSQEAAYLAEGQARLALEIDANLAHYATAALPDFGMEDAIALGALVEIEANGGSTWYFIGPRAGGLELSVEGKNILLVTPQSPLGRELLGHRAGDTVRVPGRAGPVEHRVLTVS